MATFYDITKQEAELYSLLQDDLSRRIFWARLQCDLQRGYSHVLSLYEASGRMSTQELALLRTLPEQFNALMEQGKKMILYGADSCGEFYGSYLLADGVDFTGFCDRDFENIPEGCLGKPVYSPEYLLEHQEDCYVTITVWLDRVKEEIRQNLEKKGFSKEHILPDLFQLKEEDALLQYFEFPELIPKDGAFVDGGCFDGKDSIRFYKMEGRRVFAFEPDSVNYQRCKANLQNIEGAQLFCAGLGERRGEVSFAKERDSACSHVTEGNDIAEHRGAVIEKIQVMALDDCVDDCKVGFIKMDIEGAEMEALRGAERTILRDKPLIAASVYHKPGDVLAIMDYLNCLNPDYRFWLRHYQFSHQETVLYASV